MDALPGGEVIAEIREVAERMPEVLAIEKVFVRRSGIVLHIAVHGQSSPSMSLTDADATGGRVKAAIRQQMTQVGIVLMHMEPFGDTA